MIADKTIVQDGKTYYPGDAVPELGSLVAVDADGDIRKYEGLISDQYKLPHYVDTGSSAFLYDAAGNSKEFHFEKTTDKWYEIRNRSGSSGGGGGTGEGGVTDYRDLTGLPTINGTIVIGDLTLEDIGIQIMTPDDVDEIIASLGGL